MPLPPDRDIPFPANPDPQMTEKTDAQNDVPVHDVLSLTAGGSLARLVHQGEVYVLRITRLGKLILTK